MSASPTGCLRLGFAGRLRLLAAVLAAMVLAALLSAMPAVEAQSDPITVRLASAEGGAVTEPLDDSTVTDIHMLSYLLTLSRALVSRETVTVQLTFSGNAALGTDYELRCPTPEPTGVSCNSLNTSSNANVVFTGLTGGETAGVIITVVAKCDRKIDNGTERCVRANESENIENRGNGETAKIELGSISASSGITTLKDDRSNSFIIVDLPAQTDRDPLGVTLKFDTQRLNRSELGTTYAVTAEAGNPMPRDVSFPLEFAFGDAATAMFASPEPWLVAATQGDVDVPSSIVIPHGKIRGSVSLTYVDDDIDETLESFFMRFDADNFPAAYKPKTEGEANNWKQFRIIDDDATRVTLTRTGGASIDEGEIVDYTLSLSRGLGGFEDRPGTTPNGYESLTASLFFDYRNTATLGTDFTLACPTNLPTGVTCAGLDTTNPSVTFNADPTPGDLTAPNNYRDARITATSVTITLAASADDVVESGGELVRIGIGALAPMLVLNDHSAERAPDPRALGICDPGTNCISSTDSSDPPPSNPQPSDPQPPNPQPPNPQPPNPSPSNPSSPSSSSTSTTQSTTQPDSDQEFTDLDEVFDVHRDAVNAFVDDGVFDRLGCEANRLCPDQTITRWRLAVIMIRQLEGTTNLPAAITRSLFSDVDAGLWWAPYVQRLSRLEITRGCATDPLRYCPDRPLTRAQAASFLARTYELTTSTNPGFVDIEGSVHADAINALYAAGITKGCATDPLRYCPERPLSLQEFATMLNRAKN